MKIGGIGNLCLWCMEDMGENSVCPHCGHNEREPMRTEQTIPAGTIIGGHYLTGRILGQGGFGITYLAYDLDLHVKRAIKEYFPQGLVMRVGNSVKVTRQSVKEAYEKGVDSFYREAQSIARFGGHPNVVQVHGFFRENDTAYFVMDYVEGISFQQYLNDRGGRISWEEALHILKPIGEALTALHEAHLLHRDVKPDNIFITRNGTPKLLDFGAARYETSESTHSSAAVLTPGYAPVEQYGSVSMQGTFTDVYALSATFYRAVSGMVPIPAPDRMMQADPLAPLDKVDGRVPAAIGTALSHGMGVRRETRTQTVEQLLKELQAPQTKKSAKWLPLAVVVLLLAGGIGALMSRGGGINPDIKNENMSETQNAMAFTQTAWENIQLEASSVPSKIAAPIIETVFPTLTEVPRIVTEPAQVPTNTSFVEPSPTEAAVQKKNAVDSRGTEWAAYDQLISDIKSTTDSAKRADMMHEAEDMLMETGALLPIYYYNDDYMQKSNVTGIYASLFGTKYFMYAQKGSETTLRINLASEPDYLDPALNSSVDGACLAVNTFGGLYKYNAEGNLTPDLAESYKVSEDGLTYTFTLRDGLKWSDGSDLTSADFVYSWKRAADPETAADYSYMLNGIAGYDEFQYGDADALQVSAPDAKTFVVTLKAPCAYMLDLAAFPTFFPVKQSVVEAAADWKTNPGAWAQKPGFVSCGAYVLKSWNHDESMVYVKNPYWYDADKVKIERLEFMLSADDVAIYSAYKAGDLDFTDSVPTDEIANLNGKDPEFHIIDNRGTYFVVFNVNSPLFDGKTAEQANAMRRAFSKLIDRQYIIDTIAQGGQLAATSFIPAGMADGNGGIFKSAENWHYPVENGYYGSDADVDGAIELLKSAGFEFTAAGKLSAATPISFEYLTNESTGHIAIAECIQQNLAAVGINMTIRSIDWNVFLNDRKAGSYDAARHGWLADFNDPINMLEMWATDSGNNDAQFGRG